MKRTEYEERTATRPMVLYGLCTYQVLYTVLSLSLYLSFAVFIRAVDRGRIQGGHADLCTSRGV